MKRGDTVILLDGKLPKYAGVMHSLAVRPNAGSARRTLGIRHPDGKFRVAFISTQADSGTFCTKAKAKSAA